MIGIKQPDAPDELALLPLTARFEDDHAVYFNAIESALTGDDRETILNIALTGGYGVGKSSILRKVVQKHSRTVVQVSLSTLGLSDDLGGGGPQHASRLSTTNRIQKEIVKQLLYREDPGKTPGSRFRRIGRFKFWRELGIALLAGFVIALAFYLTGWTEQLAELVRPYLEPGIGMQAAVLVSASAFVLAIRFLAHDRIRIEKVSAGTATILLSHESTSFFDQYLDEIVYFFDATSHDIVIFEDIDRFDDPHIFETLRALNTLLNGAKQLRGRKIRFIYAIKDSIFDELGRRGAREEGELASSKPEDAAELALARANRTKFFDLVIPVVPFVTHRSARDLMAKLMAGLEPQVSPELIDLAARHVADMRLIKNVRNEFVIFSQKVISDGSGLALNSDSLFAMMLYKSTHLSDFEAIRTGNSNLDVLYRAGRNLVNQNITRLNTEARAARDRLSKIQTASLRSKTMSDRLIEYTNRVVDQLGGTIQFWLLDGDRINPKEFGNRAFWEKLSEDCSLATSIRLRTTNQTLTLSLRRADLVEVLRDPLSLQDWQDSDRASLNKQLEGILTDRAFLAHADMRDLMAREHFTVKSTDGTVKSFRQLAKEYLGSELARQLVQEGHINRDFTLYTSTYYAERVSSKATNFIMHNVDPNVTDVHFELTDADVEAVLRERGTSTLRERAMYNISIVDYLLRTNAPDTDLLVNSLQTYGEDEQLFFQAYLAEGKKRDTLIRKLAGWPRIFTFVVSEAEVDEADRVHLFDVALESAADDIHYIVDGRFRDYLEANYAELQILTSNSTGAKSAARVAKLLVAADGILPSLAPLAETTRQEMVATGRYAVTRDNLVLALEGEEDLALDVIRDRASIVFDHVLNSLASYLTAFMGDEAWPHTVNANAAFGEILDQVIEEDDSQLDAIVAAASAECVVVNLAAVSTAAWPSLAKHGRFPITFGNVRAYIDEFGGIDEHLAASIAAAGKIEASGTDATARSVLAAQLLAAHDVLPEPELRVDLVASLELEHWLSVESVKSERGHLIGLLVEKRVIADNAESFALAGEADWPTREFAISKSDKFLSYMTPVEVPVGDLSPLLKSDLVSQRVKSEILNRFSDFAGSADRATLAVVAEYAVSTHHTLTFEDLSILAEKRVQNSLILRLLEPLLVNLSITDLTPLLRTLGGVYPQLTERNGKRPELPDTSYNRALVQRLEQLGTVSSSRPSERKLRINMKIKR